MENPPKVNRTVPYRAVPCSGKAPYDALNTLMNSNLNPSPGGLVSFVGGPDSVLRLEFHLDFQYFFKD